MGWPYWARSFGGPRDARNCHRDSIRDTSLWLVVSRAWQDGQGPRPFTTSGMQQILTPKATCLLWGPSQSSVRSFHAPVCNRTPQQHRQAAWKGRHDGHVQHGSATSCRAGSSDDLTASNLGEVAALDQLIDLLRSANGERELTKLVAENLLAFDSSFWLRLATRADAAQSQQEKTQLSNLANVSTPRSSQASCISY